MLRILDYNTAYTLLERRVRLYGRAVRFNTNILLNSVI